MSTRWWLLVDHCVLRNWDRILVRAVKGLISRAGMVSICPLLWQRDVKLQQTKPNQTTNSPRARCHPLPGPPREWWPVSESVVPNNGTVGNQILCAHSRCFGSYFDVIILAPPAERQRSFSNAELSVVRLSDCPSVKSGGGVNLRNASVTFFLFWHGAYLGWHKSLTKDRFGWIALKVIFKVRKVKFGHFCIWWPFAPKLFSNFFSILA